MSGRFKKPKQPVGLHKLFASLLSLMIVSACTDYGQVKNTRLTSDDLDQKYSMRTWKMPEGYNEVSIVLTFSGGGTRAAALAYGVMQELRDTNVVINGHNQRLLDQVNHISSVSGGSFTSAYYGLHGDGVFETFEDDFLRKDVDKALFWKLANPVLWFSKTGRTDAAIKYYQKEVFHGATFADMNKPNRPMIIINASDLAYGVRFSFIQEYFDLLCSDLSTFPVARAVAASSAVPVLFEPVVIENYSDCSEIQRFGASSVAEAQKSGASSGIKSLADQLATYNDKENRKYIHFVDGGITDNLGLRALSDIFAISGGAAQYMKSRNQQPPKRMVVIAVNATTESHRDMEESAKEPHIGKVIGAVSSLQLERMDWDTTQIIERKMDIWSAEMSTAQRPVTPYFVEVGFTQLKKEVWPFYNKIPTSFTLSDEQVDKLIEAGRQLLRENPTFQALLSDLGKP